MALGPAPKAPAEPRAPDPPRNYGTAPVSFNIPAAPVATGDVVLNLEALSDLGITAIEAIKMGVPVIASNVSALPEIIGGGGLLVDDYLNPVSWAGKMKRLMNDDTLRSQLVHLGCQHAEKFSWNASARQLIDLYTRLLLSR